MTLDPATCERQRDLLHSACLLIARGESDDPKATAYAACVGAQRLEGVEPDADDLREMFGDSV